MKGYFNPLIEKAANALFAVDQYADIFEKIALQPGMPALLRRLCRRKIAGDVRASSILFIHVPKNGGTSIKRALYASDPGHVTIRYYDLFAPELLRASATLAVLRDPVERFLSAYDFLLNGGGRDVRIQAAPLRRLAHIKSIDGLLDHLENIAGDWFKVDTFARPQWWYITDAAQTIRVKHVWLLEEPNERLTAFLRSYGVEEIQHVNRTHRSGMMLTSQQERRLQRIYRIDFDLYQTVKRAGGYSDALEGIILGRS